MRHGKRPLHTECIITAAPWHNEPNDVRILLLYSGRVAVKI